MSIEILDCLKRKRDICVKAIITSQNTAFMLTPALIGGPLNGGFTVFFAAQITKENFGEPATVSEKFFLRDEARNPKRSR